MVTDNFTATDRYEAGVDSAGVRAEKPLLAYTVQEEGEGTGGVVFARSNVEARRLGASQWGDGEFGGLIVRRAPWADHCAASGVVPASLMVEAGWWFECAWSGARIDLDYLDDKGWKASGVVGSQHGPVFACKRYEQRYKAQKRREAEARERVIAQMKAIVLRRLPGVTFREGKYAHHWYGHEEGKRFLTEEAFVSFDWPGQKIGPASFRVRREQMMPDFECCQGDREAFEAFAASTLPTPGGTDDR